MEDVSISIYSPDNYSPEHYSPEHEISDVEMLLEDENADYSFGVPKIKVLRKFPDWSVLQLSRGTAPKALLQWISANTMQCFERDTKELLVEREVNVVKQNEDQEYNVHMVQPSKKPRVQEDQEEPVLASPHYADYASSLVLVARNATVAKTLTSLTTTVHALVQGYQKPGEQLPQRIFVCSIIFIFCSLLKYLLFQATLSCALLGLMERTSRLEPLHLP